MLERVLSRYAEVLTVVADDGCRASRLDELDGILRACEGDDGTEAAEAASPPTPDQAAVGGWQGYAGEESWAAMEAALRPGVVVVMRACPVTGAYGWRWEREQAGRGRQESRAVSE
jgi:hypothetical protein